MGSFDSWNTSRSSRAAIPDLSGRPKLFSRAHRWRPRANIAGETEILRAASASPMESLRKNIESKWKYLTAQEAMRRAPVLTMSRLFSWRARCLLRCAAIARLPRWDVQMFLPANWRGVEKLIFAFREYYEPELDYLKQILSPGMTFVDAGACYGIYTLAASKMVGQQGRVIAFEPASRVFRVLRKNIELNGLTNVLAYPLALTE